MILRSPAEDENGGISFHMVLASTRHFRRRTDQPQIAWLARARGNPGLLRRISLDTRFRGYDGTQPGLLVLIPERVFSREARSSQSSESFLIRNFLLRALRASAVNNSYLRALRVLRGAYHSTVNSE